MFNRNIQQLLDEYKNNLVEYKKQIIYSYKSSLLPVFFGIPLITFASASINRVEQIWNFEDTFSADKGWSGSGAGNAVDTGNTELDFNITSSATGIAIDVQDADVFNGQNFSDTAWEIRFSQFRWAAAPSTNAWWNVIGAATVLPSSFPDTGAGVDSIVGNLYRRTAGDIDYAPMWYTDGGSRTTAIAHQDVNLSNATDYFLMLQRISATSAGGSLSSTSGFTHDIISKMSATIASTVQNLRYLGLYSATDANGSLGNGTVQMIQAKKDAVVS